MAKQTSYLIPVSVTWITQLRILLFLRDGTDYQERMKGERVISLTGLILAVISQVIFR